MSSKNQEKRYNSEELLKRAQKCKGEEFEGLLKEIEAAIEESEEHDEKLLRAKKAVTTRMVSRRK